MATDSKTIVRRWDDELWNQPSEAAADRILAENMVWHHPTFGEVRGRKAVLDLIVEMRAAYPDLKDTIKHMVAEGDMVATHYAITGTHRGPYRGAKPSNQQISWEGVTLHRVENGKIVEQWGFPHTSVQGSPHHIIHQQGTHTH